MRISKNTLKQILAGLILGLVLFFVLFLWSLRTRVPITPPPKNLYTSYSVWAKQFVPQETMRVETKKAIVDALNKYTVAKNSLHWYSFSFRPVSADSFALDLGLEVISKDEDMRVYQKGGLMFLVGEDNYFGKPVWQVNVRTKNAQDIVEFEKYLNLEKNIKQNNNEVCYAIDDKCVILANGIYVFYSYFYNAASQYQVYFSLLRNINPSLKGTFYGTSKLGDNYNAYVNMGGLAFWDYTFLKTEGYDCAEACDYGYVPSLSDQDVENLEVVEVKSVYMFLPVTTMSSQDLVGGYLLPFYLVHLRGHKLINNIDYTLNIEVLVPAESMY